MDCLFCKIIKKKIPATIIYEDDEILSFNDINPQSPVHILIIPKEHITDINQTTNAKLMGKLIITAKDIAHKLSIAANGYRLIINCGDDGGQEVGHIHLHLLAGRQLKWPPG